MSDITKCTGIDCPHKNDCYRFTAPMSDYQYMLAKPPVDDNGRCDMYWGKNGEKIWITKDNK